MKHILALLLLIPSLLLGQTFTTPIANGKLTSTLDGNSQTIKLLGRLGVGTATPTDLLHVKTSSTTAGAGGITIGPGTGDVTLHRSASGVLTLTGNLQVTGTIGASAGVVLLGGTNTFTGANAFNAVTTLAGAVFSAPFTVPDSGDRASVRGNLGLAIGTDVQGWDAALDDIAGLATVENNIIVANSGGHWVVKNGASARTALGVTIGTNVQAWSARLDDIAAIDASPDAGLIIVGNGTNWVGQSGSTARTSLGLGTGDNVTFTNGAFTGTLSAGASTLAATSISSTLAVTGAVTLTTPLGTGSGGFGVDFSGLVANRFPYTTGTGAFGSAPVTATALTVLDDTTVTDMRQTLGLGTSATHNVPATGNAGASETVLGNDSRLSDSRAPTGTAGGDLTGTYPNPTIAADAVALSTDTVGSYVASLTAGTGVSFGGTNGVEGAIPTINIGQSVATTANVTFNNLTLTGNFSLAGSVSLPAVTLLNPATHDGTAIGSASLRFSDLWLATGAVITFGDSGLVDMTLTHSAGSIAVDGGGLIITTPGTTPGSVVTIDGVQDLSGKTLTAAALATSIAPTAHDGVALGTFAKHFSDLYLATGATIIFGDASSTNVTLQHSSGVLAVTGGYMTLSAAGTGAGSVATIDGTQTLTAKTYNNAIFTGTWTASGSSTLDLSGSTGQFKTPTGNTTISGTATAVGAITPTGGVAAAGGFSMSPRGINTGQAPAMVSTDGSDATAVNTETYISEISIPANCTVTGIAVFNGNATGSGNIQVSLADSSGNPIVAAKSASTTIVGTDAYQLVPFTAPYSAVGPATYYIMVQYSSNTTHYNAHTLGHHGVTKQTAQTYGTFTTFSPPTTFTTAIGNMCGLY